MKDIDVYLESHPIYFVDYHLSLEERFLSFYSNSNVSIIGSRVIREWIEPTNIFNPNIIYKNGLYFLLVPISKIHLHILSNIECNLFISIMIDGVEYSTDDLTLPIFTMVLSSIYLKIQLIPIYENKISVSYTTYMLETNEYNKWKYCSIKNKKGMIFNKHKYYVG